MVEPVNVICTFFPCKLVNSKLPLLTCWIVPEAAVRQFVDVVAVAPPVELLVLEPLLPQATSTSIIIGMRRNNLFIVVLNLRTLPQFPTYASCTGRIFLTVGPSLLLLCHKCVKDL